MVLSLSPIWEKDDSINFLTQDYGDEESKGNSGCLIFLLFLIILLLIIYLISNKVL